MVAQAELSLMNAARYALVQRRQQSPCAELWTLLDQVKDPEVPVLNIWQLGVLQDVQCQEGKRGPEVTITLTPTYSGCPALQTMVQDVQMVLASAGFEEVEVIIQLAPAWTTDWLDRTSRERLKSYGIAPPNRNVECPQCGSASVVPISEFGSTACKALYRCERCQEPFDYFKEF